MKNTVFKGIATAMVTPMTSQGIDYDALARLIDFQIENGINALVPTGTTGESATLSPEERMDVIRFTLRRVDGRVPVIAGTGTNDTRFVLEFTKFACDNGADAVLVVTPYYNKSTQGGLIAHYTAVADASDKPVILYNVPSRTGCNLLPETVSVLADHPRICGIKEASGNMGQVMDLFTTCGDRIDIYSGEDGLIQPMMAMGGMGCISVISNIMPKETVALADMMFRGEFREAAQLQCKLLPLIHSLFSEVNPIPVKAALSEMGFGENYVRLPLIPMTQPNKEILFSRMRELGVIK
jgi:4-hydroxy-tetrahydrodipicolinate synthase